MLYSWNESNNNIAKNYFSTACRLFILEPVFFSFHFHHSLVKREVDNSDDEAIKVREQAILELGQLLAETKQAEGISFHSEAVVKVMSVQR